MHSLVRRYIKTGVGFLIIGILLGLVYLVRRELWGIWPTRYETSAHTHAILVGFVMMMIQGVALWLFPRPGQGDARYRPALANGAYWCLTIGTTLRLSGELLHDRVAGPSLGAVALAGGVLQAAGIGLFFFTMWSRVRAVGSAAREARGERF